eukprot:2903478-Rhodomonas_salina.1
MDLKGSATFETAGTSLPEAALVDSEICSLAGIQVKSVRVRGRAARPSRRLVLVYPTSQPKSSQNSGPLSSGLAGIG